MKRITGSTLTLIAGIGLVAFGGVHFYQLAIAPHFKSKGQ